MFVHPGDRPPAGRSSALASYSAAASPPAAPPPAKKSGGEGKNDAKPKSGERKEESGISLASAEEQIPLEEEFSEF